MSNQPNHVSAMYINNNSTSYKTIATSGQNITAQQQAQFATVASRKMFSPCYNRAGFLSNKIPKTILKDANVVSGGSPETINVFQDYMSGGFGETIVKLGKEASANLPFPTVDNVHYTITKSYLKIMPNYASSLTYSDNTIVPQPKREYRNIFFVIVDYSQRVIKETMQQPGVFSLANANDYNPVYNFSRSTAIPLTTEEALAMGVKIEGAKTILSFTHLYFGDTQQEFIRAGASFERIIRFVENTIIRAKGMQGSSYQQMDQIITAGLESVYSELRSKGNFSDANTIESSFLGTNHDASKVSCATNLGNLDFLSSVKLGLTTLGRIGQEHYYGAHAGDNSSGLGDANRKAELGNLTTRYETINQNYSLGQMQQALTSTDTLKYTMYKVQARQLSLQNAIKEEIYAQGYINSFFDGGIFVMQNPSVLNENYHMADSRQTLDLRPLPTNDSAVIGSITNMSRVAAQAYAMQNNVIRGGTISPDYSKAVGVSLGLFYTLTDSNGMHYKLTSDNTPYNPQLMFQGGFKYIPNFYYVLQPNSYNNITGNGNYIYSPTKLELSPIGGTTGAPANFMTPGQITQIAGTATDFIPQTQDAQGNLVVLQGAQTLPCHNRTLNNFYVGTNKSNAVDPFLNNLSSSMILAGQTSANAGFSVNIFNTTYTRPDQYNHFTVIGVTDGITDGIKRNTLLQNKTDEDWKLRYVDVETEGSTIYVKTGGNPMTVLGDQPNNEYDIVNTLKAVTGDLVFFDEWNPALNALNPLCGIQTFGASQQVAGQVNPGAQKRLAAGLVWNLKHYVMKIPKGTKISLGKREWMIDVVTGQPIPLQNLSKIPQVANVLTPESNTFFEGALQCDVVIYFAAAGDYISGRAPQSQSISAGFLSTTFLSNLGTTTLTTPQQGLPVNVANLGATPVLGGLVRGAGAQQIGCAGLGYTNRDLAMSSSPLTGDNVSQFYFTEYSSNWNVSLTGQPSFATARGEFDDAINIESFPISLELRGRTDKDVEQDNNLATVRKGRSRSGVYQDVIEEPMSNNTEILFIHNPYKESSPLKPKLNLTGNNNQPVYYSGYPVPMGFFSTDEAGSYGFAANDVVLDPVSGLYKITIDAQAKYGLNNIVPDRFFNNSYAHLLLYGTNNQDPNVVAFPDYNTFQKQVFNFATDVNTYPAGYTQVTISENTPIKLANGSFVQANGLAFTHSTLGFGIDGASERLAISNTDGELSRGATGVALMNSNTKTFLENRDATIKDLGAINDTPVEIQYPAGFKILPSDHRYREIYTVTENTGQTVATQNTAFVTGQNKSLPAMDSSKVISCNFNKITRNIQGVKGVAGYTAVQKARNAFVDPTKGSSSTSVRYSSNYDITPHFKQLKQAIEELKKRDALAAKVETPDQDIKTIVQRCIIDGNYKYFTLTGDINNYKGLRVDVLRACLPNTDTNSQDERICFITPDKPAFSDVYSHLAAIYCYRSFLNNNSIVRRFINDVLQNNFSNEREYVGSVDCSDIYNTDMISRTTDTALCGADFSETCDTPEVVQAATETRSKPKNSVK